MIKALVFDFDGLIIDTETAWYRSYLQAMEEEGLTFPLELFCRCVGTHDDELIAYIAEQAGSDERLARIRTNAALLHEDMMRETDAREGVRSFLEDARAAGLGIGLATSSNRAWIDRFLGRLGLLPYFDVILTKDDVTEIKPDPELYLRATAALGVRPSEAVAFEDSVNGAKAAKAAGLQCIIVPNAVTERLVFENYELRIASMGDCKLANLLSELTKLVEGAGGRAFGSGPA
ncbi:phosphoglycolate phosphatase [Cohnella xylanilytica]|uniref:HAD family hydrolase n=1 Tax=Cohnella xylanilytica TaxID=557555 RepID=UPI001B08B30C|nr:phosphoglycolate phosphatase [Cohnella xylanilytica]